MPVTVTNPKRIFRHNGRDYNDPAPSQTPERAVEILSATVPSLTNATIDPPKPEAGRLVFNVKTAVGTKG
ncbi:MAG: PRTRC system protein C [Opitutus sp.]|nr:PRTRC system protein C [Opitutus sp.]